MLQIGVIQYAAMSKAVAAYHRRYLRINARSLSFVEQWIELRPDVVFPGAGNVTEGAFGLGFDLCRRCFRFVVIEIEVAPTSGIGEARSCR